MENAAQPLRVLAAHEFVRRLRDMTEDRGRSFAFFLGAGCSVSSGIPAAAGLVRQWLARLRDLRCPGAENLQHWAAEEIGSYDPLDPAASYGDVMEQLFLTPQERRREIERLCDHRWPSFGYAVLAALVAMPGGCFNVVLSTNFDELVPDALYLYTTARPLVILHECLAGFIRPSPTRPLVVKLHGDHRLAPANTDEETASLKQQIEARALAALSDRGLIFIGYGGRDRGITGMLQRLPAEALPLGAYWVNRNLPPKPLLDWLIERDAIWVQSGDFDRLMLLVHDIFELPHPTKERFDRLFDGYWKTYRRLSRGVTTLAGEDEETRALKEAAERTDRSFVDWRSVELRARHWRKTDPARADEIYRTGLDQFPNIPELLNNYACFLWQNRGDPHQAEEYFKRAIGLRPADPNLLGNYAGMLLAEGRRDEGLAMLNRALAHDDPSNYDKWPAERLFYLYAHGPDDQRLPALRSLKELLINGARSEEWDFSPNIRRARDEGHPEADWLERLAAVINGEVDLSILDDWPTWRRV